MKKLPYIPNKDMYAAALDAIGRKTGYAEQSIRNLLVKMNADLAIGERGQPR